MKRLALAAVAAVTITVAVAAPAVSENSTAHNTPTHGSRTCNLDEFNEFAVKVWDQALWRRGMPPDATIQAERRWLRCAWSPGARHRMQDSWRELKRDYFAARSVRLFRKRVTPYYGCTSSGCRHYAIPAYIVECESGGRYHDPAAPNGAYSLLTGPLQGVPTWESWRPGSASGYAAPYEAPAKAQDVAAHRLWATYGSEPWECA